MGLRDFLGRAAKQVRYKLEAPGPKTQRQPRVGKTQWLETGVWVNVSSSWCARIRYVLEAQTLMVQFHSGFIAVYPNISPELAQQMFQCNSMGKFTHKHLKGRPYTSPGPATL